MTSLELRDLVKSHFSLVEATVTAPDVIEEKFNAEEVVKEEETKVEMSAESTEEIIAQEFDARTDAEEEGYLDGEKDEKEDIAEEEKEEMMDVESIVEAIISEVKDEMGKMKTKMAELEEKIVSVIDAPAAEATKMSSKPAPKAKFSTFNVESAKNADRIKAMTAQIRNHKNK